MNSSFQQLPQRAATSFQRYPLHQAHRLPAYRLHTRLGRQQRRWRSDNSSGDDQVTPLTGYYAELISQPLSRTQPATRTAPAAPSPESLPKTDKEATLERARVVFGSRLAGPGERKKELDAASRTIAGVLVPPKPTEPDNCCMSGCVNCVWDMFRDELEEWAAKSAEARVKLQAQRSKGTASGSMLSEGGPSHVATSMDDDGGGSESNWTESDLGGGGKEEDLFRDIPVGIREFMRTEKMLKTRHLQEDRAG